MTATQPHHLDRARTQRRRSIFFATRDPKAVGPARVGLPLSLSGGTNAPAGGATGGAGDASAGKVEAQAVWAAMRRREAQAEHPPVAQRQRAFVFGSSTSSPT